MQKFQVLVLVALLVAGCAAGGGVGAHGRDTDPGSVVGTTWQWESTVTPDEKIAVPSPERYTILLAPGGRLQARFDCNRGGGTYRIAAGSLTFGPMLSTRMACAPDSLDAPFMRDLERVELFYLEGGQLYLVLKPHSGAMRFRSAR